MSGSRTQQFVLMGLVFLALGGTFVFAPQIVSAVNRFFAFVFRRPSKAAPAPQASVQDRTPPSEAPAHQPVREPEGAPATSHGHSSDVVSRLRQEISLSWTAQSERE